MNAAKRASLAGMLTAPPEVPPMPARPEVPEAQTPEVRSPEVRSPSQQSTEVRTTGVRKRTAPRSPAPARPAAPPGLPKYRQLERKELLIWPDQITELSIRARSLNRKRGGAGERITQNTLIRVAVALLLSRAKELAGTTEEELRQSLGLPE
jgi:hypothetical protein